MADERQRIKNALKRIANAKTDKEANAAQAEITNLGLQLSKGLKPADQKAVFKSLDADIKKANEQRKAG